ncbi:MAG: YdcF family protein [Betaproteobacteria bacterium]|nr:YdcF family protein [Betaproteobacteria bacterium]
MPDIFLIKAIAKSLILPPTGLLLLALVGLAIIGRHPRTGRALATLATAALLALSTPIVSGTLIRLLDDSPPIDLTVAKTAQAIVIPGGGVRRNALEYGGDTLGRLTLERVRYGARLAKQTGLPLLVTGGSVLGNTVPEAVLMKEALEKEYGVPVRWMEEKSRNTRENAELTARLLRADRVHRVVLVLHAFDVPRAVPLYQAAGLDVVRAPIGIASGNTDPVDDFIPGIAALVSSYYACYELAGIVSSRLTQN